MGSGLQDLRYALRMFAHAPAFALVALAVLALGIGGNTAMFTLVNAMVFQPVAGHASDIVGVFSHDRTKPDSYRSFSYPNYVDIRQASQGGVFDGVLAHTFAMVGLPAGDTTRRIFAELVSSNYFETLRVPVAAGRAFTADEERPGANLPVAIVRYERWEAAGFNPQFVGSTIRINATDFTIVGVVPRGFGGTMALVSPDIWLPLGVFDSVVNDLFKKKGTGLADRSNETLILVGRFKPGVAADHAASRLDGLSRQLEAAFPAENRNQLLTTHPLPRLATSDEPMSDGGVAVAGSALMGVSGSVLLIASLNLANMLLARGRARRKEIAVRLSLGGTRGRIVRQLLTESLVLAALGSLAGLLLAYWAVRVLVATLLDVAPLALTFEPRPDLNVLVATTVFAVLATVMSGIGPALKLARRDPVNDLKEVPGDAGVLGRRWNGRNIMAVAQLALSLALLICGGLFARSAQFAAFSTPGFSYEAGVLASVDPGLSGYDEVRGRRLYGQLLARVRAVPGVAAAGFASTVPFGDIHEGQPVERLGSSRPSSDDQSRSATYRIIGTDYFRALGMPMLRGREFTPAEETSASTPRVAIIDERLATALFPNEDPVGQSVRIVPRGGPGATVDVEPLQVVGVARSLRENIVDREPVAHIYVPWGRNYRSGMQLHVRGALTSDAGVAGLISTLRSEFRQVDPGLPVLELTTLQRFHDRSLELWLIRAGGRMLSLFGVFALALAVIGVYGVKAYVVSQRTLEIGIRMALGANTSDVRSLIMREAFTLTAAGVICGVGLAVLLGRALGNLLFGVSGLDPLVFGTAATSLALASMVASYIPTRRAMRVAPLAALRGE
jgi:predicted permease